MFFCCCFFFRPSQFFYYPQFPSASAIRKYPVLILQTPDTRVISKGLRWMRSPHQNAKPVNQQGFPLVLSLSSHRFKIQLIPFLRAGKRNRIYTSVASQFLVFVAVPHFVHGCRERRVNSLMLYMWVTYINHTLLQIFLCIMQCSLYPVSLPA